MGHIPERMCIGCRQMYPKDRLIKYVSKEGNVELDLSGKKPGRGAYICKCEKCIDIAKKKRLLSRHFKMQIPDSIYDEAKELLNG